MIGRVQPVHPVYGVNNNKKRYPNNNDNNRNKKDTEDEQKKQSFADQLVLSSREGNDKEDVKVLKR